MNPQAMIFVATVAIAIGGFAAIKIATRIKKYYTKEDKLSTYQISMIDKLIPLLLKEKDNSSPIFNLKLLIDIVEKLSESSMTQEARKNLIKNLQPNEQEKLSNPM